MATTEEKRRSLIALVGREAAEAIFKQAAQTEKAAIEMGLKYKERKAASAPFASPPTYSAPGWTGIGAVLGKK